MASGGASTRSIFDRMMATAPAISSTVSPRTRSAMTKPPICDGVASPDIITSKAASASSRVNALPPATLPISPLKSVISPGPGRACGALRLCLFSAPSCNAALDPVTRVPGGSDIEEILQDLVPVLRCDRLGVELHAVDGQAAMHHAHDHV